MAVGEMVRHSHDQPRSVDLTAELLFRKLDPERRARALAAARSLHERDELGARDSIRLADWQAAAAVERKRLIDDPGSAGIVRELDLILALKP